MKIRALSVRMLKEILRDPLNLCFGAGFPLLLLILLHTIDAHGPMEQFRMERLAPGAAVFGLSFLTLFSATVISRDRESALLHRLYTAPLTARHFILGYTLPMLPLALLQCALCYAAGLLLGLEWTGNILPATVLILPDALLYIALGLLCGTLLNVRQVGAVCGALLTNLTAWLSGIWFDVSLLGSFLEKLSAVLPFSHAVEMERAAVRGDLSAILPHLGIVTAYGFALLAVAAALFSRRIQKQ